jgi:protein-disulfide isomerase
LHFNDSFFQHELNMITLRQCAASTLGALTIITALSVASGDTQSDVTNAVAEVNGGEISAEELNRTLGAKLAKLEEQIFDLKRKQLDLIIADRLLTHEAARRGISIAALLDQEVTAQVGLITEQEIDAFYEENKTRIRADSAPAREKIRAFLQQHKLMERRELFIEGLKSQSNVIIRLKPPTVIRVNVSTDGAPFRGAADAPVTIVEFSEFQCPFCNRAQPTLKQILERYPGKVKLVHRDFPIDSLHPRARPAAEAARCAQDQGKFWDYHDLLFASFPQAAPDDLQRLARQVGLDMTKFESCLSGGMHKTTVQRDIEEGTRLGVTGTPAFFINGRALTGAQPLQAFTRVIDDELARTASRENPERNEGR